MAGSLQRPARVNPGPSGFNRLQQCELTAAINSLIAGCQFAPSLSSFAEARAHVVSCFSSLGAAVVARASHNYPYYARMFLRGLAGKFAHLSAHYLALAARGVTKADVVDDFFGEAGTFCLFVLRLREAARRAPRLTNARRRALLLEELQRRFVAAGLGRERSNQAIYKQRAWSFFLRAQRLQRRAAHLRAEAERARRQLGAVVETNAADARFVRLEREFRRFCRRGRGNVAKFSFFSVEKARLFVAARMRRRRFHVRGWEALCDEWWRSERRAADAAHAARRDFRLVSQNCQGAARNAAAVLAGAARDDAFGDGANAGSADVVLMQETLHHDERPPGRIDGWSSEFLAARPHAGNGARGGVAVYCRDMYLLSRCAQSSGVVASTEMQWLFCCVCAADSKIVVGSLYAPPLCSFARLPQFFEQAIELSLAHNTTVLVGGDWNHDVLARRARPQDASKRRLWETTLRNLSQRAVVEVTAARGGNGRLLATRQRGSACIDYFVRVRAVSRQGPAVPNCALVDARLCNAGLSDHFGIAVRATGPCVDLFWQHAQQFRAAQNDQLDDEVRVRWRRLNDAEQGDADARAQRDDFVAATTRWCNGLTADERVALTLPALRDRVQQFGAAAFGVDILPNANVFADARSSKPKDPPWFDVDCRALAAESRRLCRELQAAQRRGRLAADEIDALWVRRRAVSVRLSATLLAKKAAYFARRAAAWTIGDPSHSRAAFGLMRSLLRGRDARRQGRAALARVGAHSMLTTWTRIMGEASNYAEQASDLTIVARSIAQSDPAIGLIEADRLLAIATAANGDLCANLVSVVDGLVARSSMAAAEAASFVSENNVALTLSKLKRHSAPGIDSVPQRMLAHAERVGRLPRRRVSRVAQRRRETDDQSCVAY
jgi:hypothetical protein